MAILEAMGYGAMSDPATCVEQGYAESEDYYECYAKGSGFANFTAPNTLDHRYLHEDIGMGLVLWRQLAELVGVATPTFEAFIRIGSAISGIDYAARGARTLKTLGLQGLDVKAIREYLRTGER
jgi:opine dehydrogenase